MSVTSSAWRFLGVRSPTRRLSVERYLERDHGVRSGLLSRPRVRLCGGFGDSPNLAEIGAERRRAADRVARRRTDQQVVAGTRRPEGIVAGRTELLAALPEAMLPHHHARIEVGVEAGPRAHARLGRLDRDPVAFGDPASLRRRGMQLDLGILGALAQTRERAVLRLAEHG